MKVTLDMAGITKVLNEGKAVAAQRESATALVEHAHATGRRGAHSGAHIVDKIAVGDTRQTDKGAVTTILWPSPFWHFEEFGTANQSPDRTITRSAQHVGLRVVDDRG